MPFTLSHPAAVVPLARLPLVRRLPLAALVTGSMAPDLVYFLPVDHFYGHRWPGGATFSLPCAVGLYYALMWWLRWPLTALAPPGLRRRLTPGFAAVPLAPGRVALVLVAAAVGIATHVAWDEFTHRFSWTAAHLHWLKLPIARGYPRTWVVADALQVASSVLGLGLLAGWIRGWYRRVAEGGDLQPRVWSEPSRVALLTLVALACVLVGGARVALCCLPQWGWYDYSLAAAAAIHLMMKAACVGLAALCCAWTVLRAAAGAGAGPVGDTTPHGRP
jgi:hypothetical protein